MIRINVVQVRSIRQAVNLVGRLTYSGEARNVPFPTVYMSRLLILSHGPV
jgi:hypothetical protein